MSLPRPSSIPFAFITALLNRTPGLQDVAPLTHLRSSQVAATLSVALCWSADDLAVWAKQGSAHAYLAVDFVLVEHHGTEMQGLDIQYRGGRAVTALSHRFLSAGLVEPGRDPVPLRFDYAVSKRLQTDQFPYFTASQSTIAFLDLMAEQGIQFKGLLVDAEFTTHEVTHYCIDHNISILGRIKSNSSVNFNGKTLKLSDLASLFPPKVCHYTAEFNWRSKRIPVKRGGRNVDIVIIYRKEHGVWKAFFLISTFPSEAVSLGDLLRAWKARWGIEVIHRLVKQNLSFGKCRYRNIRAHQNWAALVVQAFHAILDVRRRHPELNWRAAQRQAAQEHLEFVRTALFPSSCVLEAV